MKKKKKHTNKRKKIQKIDVVLESLLNLELQVKTIIQKIEQLQSSQPYYPNYKNNPFYRYDDITWTTKGLK